MFGESESESPRVGSPWEAVILQSGKTPPSELKLVPENEEVRYISEESTRLLTVLKGNCEYKLQLLSPSPARLARLITQLKWRLLEGGGQALYQIGVADSGNLIGLTRTDLERSLETLEIMAGEIGASVIVVREVHVRGSNAALLQDEDFARRRGFHRQGRSRDVASPSTVPTAWGPAIKETADGDEEAATETEAETDVTTDLEPEPAGDSSAVFSMDLDTPATLSNASSISTFALAISSVYKPRTPPVASTPIPVLPDAKPSSRRYKRPPHPFPEKKLATNVGDKILTKGETKALTRKLAREKRREYRNERVAQSVVSEDQVVLADQLPRSTSPEPLGAEQDVLDSLQALALTDPNATDKHTSENKDETRLIVEVLVVRKLSMSEAFLDFDGFGTNFSI